MLQKTSLNSYHHSESLIVQFVLNDFLLTLEEAAVIQSFTEEAISPEEFIHRLNGYLVNLAGSEQAFTRIFSWIVDSGVLTKLKNAAELLSERSKKGDCEHLDLHLAAHKAWLDCMETVNLLQSFESRGDVATLKKTVEKCLASIRKIKPAIKKILPKYSHDENVIHLILRHQESFDLHFGNDWTKKFINIYHPEGVLGFMTEKFTERGFANLIPEISLKLEEVLN